MATDFNSYSISSGKGSLAKGYTAAYRKRLEDEEEKAAEQALIEAQKQQEEQKKEDSKPWYQKAAEATGNFVKDAAVDVYEKVRDSVVGIKDTIEGSVAANANLKDTEKYLADQKVLMDELDKATGGKTSDEDPAAWEKPEVKEIQRKLNKLALENGSGGYLTEEQKKAAGADQSVIDEGNKKRADRKKEFDEAQAVDPLKTAAATAETFLNVATLGTGTAVKGGLKQGGKQVAKGLLKEGGEQLAKQGGKTVLKTAARGAAEGAVFSGAAGVTDAIVKDKDPEDAVGDIARSAIFGGLLGGASAGIAKGLQVRKGNKIVAAREAAEAADNAAIDSSAAKLADELTLDAKRPLRDVPDEELRKSIDDFQAATGRTQDDFKAYQQVKDELSTRERTAYFEKGGKTVEDAQKALDDFDAGNLPDTAYQPAAPVKNAEEIVNRQDLPVEIKNAASEIDNDRVMISQQMDELMSPMTKEVEIQKLDEMYAMKQADIEKMNPVRAQREFQKLDDEYAAALDDLDARELADAPKVQEYQQMLDTIATREQNLILDTNTLMKSAPDTFRDINPAEQAAQRAVLESDLNTAKRFTEPAAIVDEVSASPDPVKSFNRNPDAPTAFKEELTKQMDEMPNTPEVEANFKNIQGAKLGALRLMSPSQVLESMGLRGKDLDLHSNILKAESAVNAANKADSEILTRINAILPNNKQAQTQIVEYLEGTRKTLDIGDAQSAEMIRSFLDEKRAGLEKLGFGTIDDYFPHIFDKNDPDVQRLFKGKTTGKISFDNLKQRLGESDEYSRDIMDVLTRYTQGYNNKVHLEPALKPLSDLKTQVRLQNAEAKWIDGYIDQLKGFDKSNAADSYNQFMDGVFEKMGLEAKVGQNHYAQTLGTQRMVSAIATMGLNPGTAIRNMTQMVNTVADIGPKYSTVGMVDGLRMLKSKAGRMELQKAGILEGGVSQNYFDAITKPGVRGRAKKGVDGAVKGMMSLIHGTDVMLRAQAYAGAKAQAIAKGMTGEAAENYAIRKVIDTQFITSRVDMPLAFNGQGVRSLTQLATFSGKQAGFLKRMGVKMVKGADGQGFNIKDTGQVLAGVASAWAAVELLKPVLGMRETEFIPFYDQIAPFAGAITGNENIQGGDSLYRSPLVRLLAGDGKSKTGLIQALQEGDIGKFWEDNWSQIVPGGTQLKKTTEGIGTTTTGESRNASGKLRYLQDMDIDSQLKASLFGQYVTEAGQNWISEGFPTLSESQTAKVDQQVSRDAKEQYVDFYKARKKAKGRQEAYDEVKAAAKSGDYNRAARVAKEYNDKVTNSMKEYWANHQEMPEELRDEMLSNLYINVNRVVKNAKDDEND